MKLVSITLTGNHQNYIGDALKSVVHWVDVCIVIDTGVTDDSLQIARAITQTKYVSRRFPWQNDFAAARNYGLQVAKELKADWAIFVDTDERIHLSTPYIKEILGYRAGEVFLIADIYQTSSQERLFKIPASGQFIGATHEYFNREGASCQLFPELTFSEVPKTLEELQAKYQRDLDILNRLVSFHPYTARWLFYLGETQRNLGNYPAAITAYQNCVKVSDWDEEAAWACYREAECWVAMYQYQEAIATCARGLAYHAGMAELAWLAAYAAYYTGLNSAAIYWAKISITLGRFEGCGGQVQRHGFQYLEAQYEKPYDVLRYALLKQGDEVGAKSAELRYHQAYQTRLGTRTSTDRGRLVGVSTGS